MDPIWLMVMLVAIILIPSFLMSRKQRARMQETTKLQDNLRVGDRIVTTAGLHASVHAIDGELVDLEIAPGVVTTFEKIAVVRKLSAENAQEVNGAYTELEHTDGDHELETDIPRNFETTPNGFGQPDENPSVSRKDLPDDESGYSHPHPERS